MIVAAAIRSIAMRWAVAALACACASMAACRDHPAEPANDDAAPPASVPSASASPPASAPANALPVPTASVMAAVNPAGLPAYEGPTGSVEGTIFVKGDPAPDQQGLDFHACPAGAKTYGKLFREGPPAANGQRPLADALVAITGYSGFYVPEKAEYVRVTLRDCALPRTIAMTFGQRLEIANDTKLLVAPELEQAPSPAAMIPPPEQHGDPIRIYPPRPGYFTLHDKVNTLSYLRGDVYVLLHPLHAVTDERGHYRIDGVPLGELTVNARLAAIAKETSQKVQVRDGVVATVDLVLEYKRSAAAPSSAPPRPTIR